MVPGVVPGVAPGVVPRLGVKNIEFSVSLPVAQPARRFIGVLNLALGLMRAGSLSTFLLQSVLVGFRERRVARDRDQSAWAAARAEGACERVPSAGPGLGAGAPRQRAARGCRDRPHRRRDPLCVREVKVRFASKRAGGSRAVAGADQTAGYVFHALTTPLRGRGTVMTASVSPGCLPWTLICIQRENSMVRKKAAPGYIIAARES